VCVAEVCRGFGESEVLQRMPRIEEISWGRANFHVESTKGPMWRDFAALLKFGFRSPLAVLGACLAVSMQIGRYVVRLWAWLCPSFSQVSV
jgi:hypothetical protein